MAYVVMAYAAMAHIEVSHIDMAYTVMAYVAMAKCSYGLYRVWRQAAGFVKRAVELRATQRSDAAPLSLDMGGLCGFGTFWREVRTHGGCIGHNYMGHNSIGHNYITI